MKKYLVTMPITGWVRLEVEADNAKNAVEAFFAKLETIDDVATHPDAEIEWEYCEHVTEGNSFLGVLNDVEVEKI